MKRILLFTAIILAIISSCTKKVEESHSTIALNGSNCQFDVQIDIPSAQYQKVPVCLVFGEDGDGCLASLADSLFDRGIAVVQYVIAQSTDSMPQDELNTAKMEDSQTVLDYIFSQPWADTERIAVASYGVNAPLAGSFASANGVEKIKAVLMYSPVLDGGQSENAPAQYEGQVDIIQGLMGDRALFMAASAYSRQFENGKFEMLRESSSSFEEDYGTPAKMGADFLLNVLDAPLTVSSTPSDEWVTIGYEGGKITLDAACGRDAKTSVELYMVSDTTLMLETQDTVFRFKKSGIKISANNTTEVPVAFNLDPGFYQVRVKYTDKSGQWTDGEPFMIGVNPEEIVSPADKAADFDEFWEKTLAELADVPLEPVFTLLPERSDSLRNVYIVEFKSLGNVIMGGVLAEPVKPGKYPAYLQYMGYSENPSYYRGADNPDVIEFHVSVRGQGIYKESSPLKDRWEYDGLESKETYYYRGAFCDVIRAIDFIASRPSTDPERIFARGESQGGAFGYVAAALDERIKAISVGVTFLGDFPDYVKVIGEYINPILIAAEEKGIAREDMLKTLSYFDVKNFTGMIKCPVFMGSCLQDPTCPPHTVFAAYNNITSPKEYIIVPEGKHDIWSRPAFIEGRSEFFKRFSGSDN